MKNDLPKLSEAQLEVMNVIWELRECSVVEVLDQLRQRRDIARNTVQTTMARLDEKGWLVHEDVGGKFVYRASVPREQVQRDCVDGVVQSVFDGSAEGLVLALLQNRSLSRGEATRIRKMIQEAEKRS